MVAEASEPRHLDPTIEHQIWEGQCTDLPGNRDGSPLEDHRLQRFASILASFPGIELAQYDSARCRDKNTKSSLFQIFRLFDHQRRGPAWLQKRVEEAQQLVYSDSDPRKCEEYQFKLDKKDPSGVGSFLGKILRIRKDFHDDVFGTHHTGRYIYLLVHCTDYPGLFADLSVFLQSEPGADRLPARRKIFLGACRGMGEQGIVLLAANADKVTDASETVLSQRLHQFLESHKRGADIYRQHYGEGKFHVYDARVFVSTEIPGMLGAGDASHGYVTVEARHPFDAPGLLRGICDVVLQYGGDEANFYLIDGRSHRRPGETDGSFGLAIGLVVNAKHGPELRDQLERHLGEGGWSGPRAGQGPRVEWQPF